VWWHGRGEQIEPAVSDAAPAPAARRPGRRAKEDDPMIRKDLVERVRREIAAGTYDTPQKWEVALDRLLEHLDMD
jgi:hypothetical protein